MITRKVTNSARCSQVSSRCGAVRMYTPAISAEEARGRRSGNQEECLPVDKRTIPYARLLSKAANSCLSWINRSVVWTELSPLKIGGWRARSPQGQLTRARTR